MKITKRHADKLAEVMARISKENPNLPITLVYMRAIAEIKRG